MCPNAFPVTLTHPRWRDCVNVKCVCVCVCVCGCDDVALSDTWIFGVTLTHMTVCQEEIWSSFHGGGYLVNGTGKGVGVRRSTCVWDCPSSITTDSGMPTEHAWEILWEI
eukprot:m.383039 g.383039  ORF g.383039 m.383039 type:complete len:110 (+) comp28259_c2_seq22:481-810(+)